jgi:8-oxo-dGTP pyrophosphatase MutT (NUDIX family)
MSNSVIQTVELLRRPMICEEEVSELVYQYGTPLRRSFTIQADEYIRSYRWRADLDRRAEVVFAIQDPIGRIWLHAKSHYPGHIVRLPSGGIGWDETIQHALFREVEEETGLCAEIKRFLGLIEYRFQHNGSTVKFASYIFHLFCGSCTPTVPNSGEISAFRPVLPSQLSQITVDMRNMIGDRRGWGQWRALAHDLVYDMLSK